MSKIIPELCNFITIGAWNPAIIQPNWLKKYFPEIPDTCNIEIASVGVASAFRMSYPKFSIDPNNGRLVFIPKEMSEDLMVYISRLSMGIQTKLEHTPIFASGSNFAFQLIGEESFTLDEIEKDQQIAGLYKDFKEQGNIVSRSIMHTFSLKDYSVNIYYDYKGRDKMLRINFDYHGANPMKRSAEGLVNNYKYSLKLSEKLIRN
jgi:hypothetical protein